MKNTVIILSIIILIFSACGTQQKTLVTPEQKSAGMTEPQKRGYWQQYVHYTMDIDMDTDKHQFTGKQKLVYKNNSHDTLDKVYYHLYWNAFQPGSAMDWRARSLPDPDRNLNIIIQALKPDETGWTKIKTLTQDGQNVSYKVNGTILEVTLNKAILPGQSTVFDMDFQTQIPIVIRRAGRNNSEGIDYSMAQWYPKMCEYDTRGWHSEPYIGREFYGVWGDFDVTIHIDKKYTVPATGVLQNPENIPANKGFATQKERKIPDGDKLTWHYKAKNVHDFSWAADPDYIHDILKVDDSLKLHFFYQNDKKIIENWKKLEPVAVETMKFYNDFVGRYPYKQYSVVQAGDGGMEYAQLTFVMGNKNFHSLRGTTQHEIGHAWFQFALASNESEYPWMDEGFTSFIQDMANVKVNGSKLFNPFLRSYDNYYYLFEEKKEEPLSTHSDHYLTNLAYWFSAYDKGKIILSQLGYIAGFDKLNKILKVYYKNWSMKHPQPDDFFRIAEKVSGMNLKWFQNGWIETTQHVDYKIDSLVSLGNKTKVILKNNNEMPMPVDLYVVYTNGNKEIYNIPLDLMRGQKENPVLEIPMKILPDWQYGIPQYEFILDKPKEEIKAILIDPFGYTADVNLKNNSYTKKDK